MQLLSSKVVVLFTVTATGSPPAGEDDGLGGSVSSAASMTRCVFFAVIYDAGDYPILSAYRACRDARRRVETGAPIRKGVRGGIPFRLPIFRYALLWCAAHSVTHLMCAPSFAPSTPRLPKNILRSPTFARTRATDYSHTSHRLLGGLRRRRCPSHTTVIPASRGN